MICCSPKKKRRSCDRNSCSITVSQHSNNCSSQDSNSSWCSCNITVILVIVIVAVAVIVVGVTVIAVLVRVIVSGHSTNFWSRWSRVTTGAAAVVVVVVAHATLLQSCDHCGRKNHNYGNYTNTPQRSPRACAVAADQHLSQQPGVETCRGPWCCWNTSTLPLTWVQPVTSSGQMSLSAYIPTSLPAYTPVISLCVSLSLSTCLLYLSIVSIIYLLGSHLLIVSVYIPPYLTVHLSVISLYVSLMCQ